MPVKYKDQHDKKRIDELSAHVEELTLIKNRQYRTARDYERAEQILIETLRTVCMLIGREEVSIKVMRILELYSKTTS